VTLRGILSPVLGSRSTARRVATLLAVTVFGIVPTAYGQSRTATADGATRSPPPTAPAPSAERLPVRLALSPAAAEYLTEVRVRRVLAVELSGAADLTSNPTGPLDETAVQVWVDLPEPSRVILQVKAPKRRLARRRVNISGLPWDVAARFVAIAVSQIVRRQLRPLRARRVQKPKGPSPEELERATRRLSSVMLEGGFGAVTLPGADGALVGPHLALGGHGAGFHHELNARWLVGETAAGAMRWFELGGGGDYRHWLTPSLRLTFGANAAMAAVRLVDSEVVRTSPDAADGWSARVAAAIGAQTRLGRTDWLTLTVEPGMILREVPFRNATRAGDIGGAWLGVRLGLLWDQPTSTPN